MEGAGGRGFVPVGGTSSMDCQGGRGPPPPPRRSAFLPEPFPTASRATNAQTHLHDAFGDDDEGVDYGPPHECEEGDNEEEEEEDLFGDHEGEEGTRGGVEKKGEMDDLFGDHEVDEAKVENDRDDAVEEVVEVVVEVVDLTEDDDPRGADVLRRNFDAIDQRYQQMGNAPVRKKSTARVPDDKQTETTPTITVEELEEEVGLHETTLESLNSKLQRLTAEIEHEENKSARLRGDVHTLHQRKAMFRKRTDHNLKLVKELEGSIERCLERLKKALEAFGESGVEGAVEAWEEGDRQGNGTDALPVANADEAVPSAMDPDDEDIGDLATNDQEEAATAATMDSEGDTDQQQDAAREYVAVDIPLHGMDGQRRGRKISWPSSELASRIRKEADALPCRFPSWRTNVLSAPLLRGIDSEQLIVDIMNVTVLERLLEREAKLNSGLLAGNCGWVKEEDVWGTSLDVYAHVDWEHLFRSFRRAHDRRAATVPTAGGENAAASVDPNVVLCPYELGGTCADDRCPYQHLKGTRKNAAVEGYVRYNQFPDVHLPRAFSRDDFVGKEVTDRTKSGDESASPALGVARQSAVETTTQDDSRRLEGRQYHCPVCVGDKTYSEEELRSHLDKECNNQTTQTVDGQAVTLTHVLCDSDEGIPASGGNHLGSSSNDSVGDGPIHDANDDLNDSDSAGHGPMHDANDDLSGEQSDYENEGGPSEIMDNLDYVSLPSVSAKSEDSGGYGPFDGSSQEEKALFGDTFWWQGVPHSSGAPSNTQECHGTFDNLLVAFGFHRVRTASASDSLQCMRPISEHWTTSQRQLDDVLLCSRLVDLSRVLVHMGRDAFALSAIDSACQLMGARDSPMEAMDTSISLLKEAYRSIKSLTHSRCSMAVFGVQAHLLLISESLRVQYESLCSDTAAGEAGRSLETLLDQMSYLNRPDKYGEKNMLPVGFDVYASRLTSPSSSEGGDGDMEDFIRALRLVMEKFVALPFSHLRTGIEELSFMMQCICIGKCFEHMMQSPSNEYTVASLEPIWSSLQTLLRGSTVPYYEQGRKRWLRPDTVAVAIMGPVIFGSVPGILAQGEFVSSGEKSSPKFDSRALADATAFDNFISSVTKELGRYSRRSNGRFVEPLLAPLHALSATISVAIGSMEKARLRLENLINKETVYGTTKQPTMYALSEMIWSQLVQIRMLCPSYSTAPKLLDRSSQSMELSVPDDTVESHYKIASRVVGNGVFLWGVKLRGDSHLNVLSPCFSETQCKEWEKASAKIFEERPAGGSREQTVTKAEFRLSAPYSYPGFDGLEGRSSVFPESVFLLGKSLTSLCLERCGLRELPLSFGQHLKCLKSLYLSNNLLRELPSSIRLMESLEVLNVSHNCLEAFPTLNHCRELRVVDVSHNQLADFPADLALQLHNLQSFVVNNNPASDEAPPSSKRRKVAETSD